MKTPMSRRFWLSTLGLLPIQGPGVAFLDFDNDG
jgi:hypothetical protein